MVTEEQLAAALDTALETARRGHRGANPLVGACVLDESGSLITTGFHLGAGNPHAEIEALRRLGRISKQRASELTMVVTLEPCNHTGRTGPCAQAIAQAGIGRVHYAMSDTTAAASGGADYLRSVGVQVSQGAAGKELRELNHRWILAKEQSRPFITVKTAQSLDGRINAPDGSSQWITSTESRAHAHSLRARVDAIVVGTNTVEHDNPRLNARTPAGTPLPRQPHRLIMGERDLPSGLALEFDEHFEQVRTRDARTLVELAAERGYGHLLIEGGATIASAFISADLADEIYCYQAPLIIGGGDSSVNIAGTRTLSDARHYRLDAYSNETLNRLGPDVMMHLEPLPRS
ncbi:bifunctional diaminohydroxyphosphoribosylaminopyrimidine deaminase/5-amino-6-(5-phosphoribosylamino)uracil reductase RibD [Glutamicibacter sp.]|uniref:bifunctional diaminohydroxyphosphoribosylaminopyrimidine deaminase/5-amino-6-(5-phosphoribosylamino)uracil reductase RibD n=1 Tax=Glutamicibacter sp. TaxID=1931995 RepID=UPI0028BD162F|nr:bifunctional diaminohydroxyphosphoribosylaminopyrimidine deaminase/5-amino-6-(5-phosphoribosylamino)uracil reductase RibD [Glutamicibacter sp.]